MKAPKNARRRSPRRFRYTVVFEPAEEGGYIAHVPALPGLWTQGETLGEAREMTKEAIAGYLEALRKTGAPIPLETSAETPRREVLQVALPA